MVDDSGGAISVSKVKLSLPQMLSVVSVVLAGVASTVSGLHMIGSSLRDEMRLLDDKWQLRTAAVEERVRIQISKAEERTISRFQDTLENHPPADLLLRVRLLEERVKELEEL